MATQYTSVTKYAAEHGVSPQLVRKWIADGRLKAVMVGTYWAIPVGTPRPEIQPGGRPKKTRKKISKKAR